MRFALLLIYLLTFSMSACTKLENKVDDSILQCGPISAPHLPYRYQTVLDDKGMRLPGDSLEAWEILGDVRRPLPITEKGCVAVPLKSDHRIVVRTRTGRPLGISSSASEWNDGLIVLQQANSEVILSCPEALHTNGPFLRLDEVLRGNFDEESIQIALLDGQNGKPASFAALMDGHWTIPLRDLAHGTHKVALRAENLLNAFQKPSVRTCVVNVDLVANTVDVPYAPDFAMESAYNVWRASPGQAIQLRVAADGFPQQVHYCLKEIEEMSRPRSCTESEFSLWQAPVSAPEHGLWRLELFTLDDAGNQSAVNASVFLVYHGAEIASARQILDAADLAFKNGNQIAAALRVLGVEAFRRRLTRWEALDIQNQIHEKILRFLPWAKQKSAVTFPKAEMNVNHSAIAYSQDGERILTGHDRLRITDRLGKVLKVFGALQSGSFSRVGFAENDQLAWALARVDDESNRDVVRMYEEDGSLRCSITSPFLEVHLTDQAIYAAAVDYTDMKGRIWDGHCKLIDSFPVNEESVYAFHFAADSDRYIVAEENMLEGLYTVLVKTKTDAKVIRRIELPKGERFNFFAGHVMDFQRSSGLLVVCSERDQVHIFDVDHPSEDFSSDVSNDSINNVSVDFCRFTSDGRIIHVGVRLVSTLSIYDKSLYRMTAYIRDQNINSEVLADPTGQRVIESQQIKDDEIRVKLYDMDEQPAEITSVDIKSDTIADIAMNPQRPSEFAVVHKDGRQSTWDLLINWVSKTSRSNFPVADIQVSPDGSYYLVQDESDDLLIIPSESGSPIKLETEGLGEDPWFACPLTTISLDGNLIASVCTQPSLKSSSVHIWNRTGKRVQTLGPIAHQDVTSIMMAPDANYLMLTTADGSVLMSDRTTVSTVASFSGWDVSVVGASSQNFYVSAIQKLGKNFSACRVSRVHVGGVMETLAENFCVPGEGLFDRASESMIGQGVDGSLKSLDPAESSLKELSLKDSSLMPVRQIDKGRFVLLKSRVRNSFSILEHETLRDPIDLRFDFQDFTLFANSESCCWAYSAKGGLAYHDPSGIPRMSLPFLTESMAVVNRGKDLVLHVTSRNHRAERWLLPLDYSRAVAAFCAWLRPARAGDSVEVTVDEKAICSQN